MKRVCQFVQPDMTTCGHYDRAFRLQRLTSVRFASDAALSTFFRCSISEVTARL